MQPTSERDEIMTTATKTTAARIANIWNASRQADIPAIAAFEVVLNASLDGVNTSLSNVVRVNLTHREIFFADGSILTVLDQKAAREAGLTEFDYCYKSQDRLC